MPRVKLTALNVTSLKEGTYTDELCPKLQLRVQKNRRTYFSRYRSPDGTQVYHPYGYAPSLALKDARDNCRSFFERLDAGLPVVTESKPHPRSADAETVGWLINWYEEKRAKKAKGTKTLAQNMKTLRSCLKRHGTYLDMLAREFSKADARDVRDLLDRKTPVMANRFLSYGSMVWTFAAQEDKVETNVFRDVRRLAGEEPRERVLSHDEIAAIWQAAGAMIEDGFPARAAYGRMVRFLLLTGQRRGEAAALKYGDILDGIWFQKANKASRPHKIKLSPLAMELVGQGDSRALVFQGAANQFEKRKNAIDRLCKVEDWRLHDLRRTAATGMQDIGIDETIVRAILNHAISGVSGVYLKAEYVAKKGEALKQWADEVLRIASRTKENTRKNS